MDYNFNFTHKILFKMRNHYNGMYNIFDIDYTLFSGKEPTSKTTTKANLAANMCQYISENSYLSSAAHGGFL